MRLALLFLALTCSLSAATYQQTVAVAGVTHNVLAATAVSAVKTNPAYLFRWTTQTTTADYINRPAITTAPGSLGNESSVTYFFSGGQLAANSFDSNNLWAQFNGTGFPTANWFNNTNSNIWGSSLGKGAIVLDWMYTSTYGANRLIFQLNAKCIDKTQYDANEGVSLRSAVIGGGSAPGLDLAEDLQFYDATAGARKLLTFRWNRDIHCLRRRKLWDYQKIQVGCFCCHPARGMGVAPDAAGQRHE